MSDRKKRAERREQQSREVEASQKALRESIAETERLVDDSEKCFAVIGQSVMRRIASQMIDPTCCPSFRTSQIGQSSLSAAF